MDPIVHRIGEAARQGTPDILVDDLVHLRSLCQSRVDLVEGGQKVISQPRTLLFVPAVCVFDLRLNVWMEDQGAAHRCPRICALICSQVRTLSGFACKSAMRRSRSCFWASLRGNC